MRTAPGAHSVSASVCRVCLFAMLMLSGVCSIAVGVKCRECVALVKHSRVLRAGSRQELPQRRRWLQRVGSLWPHHQLIRSFKAALRRRVRRCRRLRGQVKEAIVRSSSLADLRYHAVPVLETLRCAGGAAHCARAGLSCEDERLWLGTRHTAGGPVSTLAKEWSRGLQHRTWRLLHVDHCMLCLLC